MGSSTVLVVTFKLFPLRIVKFFYLFKPFFESILTFLDTKPEVVGSIEITGKRKLSCFSGHS